MPGNGEFEPLAFLFLAVLLFVAAIGLSLFAGGVMAWKTWVRCWNRERVEGSHTAAAHGSRVGAMLGLAGGVLSVVAPAVLLSGGRLPGEFGFDQSSLLVLMVALAPPAIWGMLSGAIAGQCKSRGSAAVSAGLMFLLFGNPLALTFGVIAACIAASSATGSEEFQLLPLAGLHCLFLFAVGAGTGVAAVCIGQWRASGAAESNVQPAGALFSTLE